MPTLTPWSLRRLRPLEWEPLDDGTNRLRDPKRNEWVRTHAWTRPVLEAIASNEADGADLAATAGGEVRHRRFLLSLQKAGYVAIDVPVPASFGRWRVRGELGRGGIGVAYACETDGAAAVAKVPWDFLHPLSAAADAIRTEAENLERLDHPGVVRRLDLLEHDGLPVLVRERVDGPSLIDLHDGKPADGARARELAHAIGGILQHAHGRSRLLVDYKPSNFLLDGGRLRLLDAGHMRPPGTARVGGTPGFMPPELERHEEATVASDIWGLGRIYAYVRSGRLPARRSQDESPLDGLPDDARPAVAALCHDEPAKRPVTVAEALSILP